jgi:hypothetical protein
MSQQTLELKETRTPNNVLTAAEMFRLTREIEKRALTAGIDPSESWAEAEATFAELLGRPVTRPNIITALTALDGVSQSRVVKPRGNTPNGNGDLDSKIESLGGRLGRLAADVGTLDRTVDEQIVELNETLARDAARLDTFESWREVIREITARHEAAIGQLVQQNTELVRRLTRLEQTVATFERPFAMNSGGELAEIQAAGEAAKSGD